MKVLLVFVMLLSSVRGFASESPPQEKYPVLYLADSGIVVMRLSVVVDDAGPKQCHETYVDALLKSLDRNGDAVVTVDEARGKILTAREAQQLQLVPADGAPDSSPDIGPKDGKISRTELLSYFKRIGLLPFSVKYQPRAAETTPNPNGMAVTTGDTPLFGKLDVNADGKLSDAELANSLEVLRKLDRDNDETISVAELQPLAAQPQPVPRPGMNPVAAPANPFVSLASGESLPKLIRRIVDKYDSTDPAKSGVPSLSTKNQRLSRMELGLPETEFVQYDVDGDGQLDFTELRQFVASAEPTLELALNLATGKVESTGESGMVRRTADGAIHLQFGGTQISFAAARSMGIPDLETLVKPLFTAVDADANGYLEKNEVPDSRLYGATFADLDPDKNGKVYLDEVKEYLKIRQDAARSRVELVIAEQGRTLFDILDSDRNGRLAHREVRSVKEKLNLWDADGDGQLAEAEIPLQFRAIAVQGSLPNLGLFPQNLAVNPGGTVARSAGPVWFRKMDRNSDGEISRREFLGDLDVFEALDLNRDGAVELNEALQAKATE